MMRKNRKIPPAPLCMALAVCGLAVWLAAYCGAFLARWQPVDAAADLLNCGTAARVTVQDRTARVWQGQTLLLQSDPAWLVEDALLGDVTGDGLPELILLVWKRGSYGPHRPFWVERNDHRFGQHIFIYGANEAGDGLRPLWMSSAVRPQVADWALNADGTLTICTPQGQDTRWAWHVWGLERIDAAPIAY